LEAKLRLTIIYDNETRYFRLTADWGFSCLVEMDARRLLFDTGGQGTILLQNMAALNLNPRSISEIFISHDHGDHLGGLRELLRFHPKVRVYLPASCPKPPEVQEVIRIRGPRQISENLFSTGELPGGEQSLVVRTGKGLAVICGCSHPGVGTILKAASRFGRVSALIGGLHGFREFELLAGLDLVCPCHCTRYKTEILARYPKTAVSGGAGKVIEFG
jgi:7,8-dihydropterin-6-yl-methyl-4-(beta-D-ribofuranosyl)aminobenzene 5'-phosphate synthase